MTLTREDILDAVRMLQGDEDLLVETMRALLDERVMRILLTRAPEVYEAFRRFVLTEELLQLPAEFREFREQVETRFDRLETELREFKQEARERFDRLERGQEELRAGQEELRAGQEELRAGQEELRAGQEELRERVGRLEAGQEELRAGQEELRAGQQILIQRVDSLDEWRRGEIARREGADYQREIVRRARRILGPGQGGSPEESQAVSDQISAWLEEAGIMEDDVPPRSDPLRADLVWWKGRKVAVAEISVKVNGDDVERARLRADTLRQAGLDAIPVVIGAEWAHPETPERAQKAGVEWRVGRQVSQGLREFHAYAP
ncbi:MAG: hypothetical protein WHS44_06660 [Fimbriimonadales bacterium]|nr:MAG: hypothetical protein KatS3mg018_1100 [Fimbriimonadales bacterium]